MGIGGWAAYSNGIQKMTKLDSAKKTFVRLTEISIKRTLRPDEKKSLMLARQELRKSAKPAMNRKNPPPGAIKIYGRCLRIEAMKMENHTYGGKASPRTQKYFHDFRTKNAIIYGLADGSLLIVAK